MFKGRWEGGNAVTLSSFSVVNSCLSDFQEGEFLFFFKLKSHIGVDVTWSWKALEISECQKEDVPHVPL